MGRLPLLLDLPQTVGLTYSVADQQETAQKLGHHRRATDDLCPQLGQPDRHGVQQQRGCSPRLLRLFATHVQLQ